MCVRRLVWLGRGKWGFEHANSVGGGGGRGRSVRAIQLRCLTRFLDFIPERNLNEKRNRPKDGPPYASLIRQVMLNSI